MSIDDNLCQLSVDLGQPVHLKSQQMVMLNDEPLEFGACQESLDIFNIFKNEQRCFQSHCVNSQQKFNDIRRSIEMSLQTRKKEALPTEPPTVGRMVQMYNQVDGERLKQKKGKMLQMDEVKSDEEMDTEEKPTIPAMSAIPIPAQNTLDQIRHLIPRQLLEYVNYSSIKEYLSGLQHVQKQPEIISDRKRRVERYLEKRRLKTWNKKICYNCRQKVAEERLRVKGRFIGRKKAIEMLGLTDRRNTAEIKSMLENISKKT